jgi:putative Holliday junction resolvase
VKEKGRVLGLDLGEVRIGVAVSDPERRVAVPLGTVRAGAPQDLRAISHMVEENNVTLVVVGHPLSLSGASGRQAQNAEKFAQALDAVLSVPVTLHDERLSTAEANRGLRAAGAPGSKRRKAVDRSAATVILQSYLDTETA